VKPTSNLSIRAPSRRPDPDLLNFQLKQFPLNGGFCAFSLARALRLQHHYEMKGFLIGLGVFLAIGLFAYFNRHVPSAEELDFEKKFDREAVLVKTCGWDPGIESGAPLKVYRFENELWFSDHRRWRRVDGKVDNVCDLLDIDAAHRESTSERPVSPDPVSRFMDLFRKSEPTPTPPKEIPPGKPNG
jgi:hypothetical protein